MNLSTLSRVLTKQFVNAATRIIPDHSHDVRFMKLFNKRNIALANLIVDATAVMDKENKNLVSSESEEFQKFYKTMNKKDEVMLCILYSIFWMGKWSSATVAAKNANVDIKKIDKEMNINILLFEYIFVSISAIFSYTVKEVPTTIYKIIEEYKLIDEDNKKECWLNLNHNAGLKVELNDANDYNRDILFNKWWRTF